MAGLFGKHPLFQQGGDQLSKEFRADSLAKAISTAPLIVDWHFRADSLAKAISDAPLTI